MSMKKQHKSSSKNNRVPRALASPVKPGGSARGEWNVFFAFLLQRLGYRTVSKGYFAFFIAVKDDGYNGRLPFRAQLVEVTPNPDTVHQLFKDAIATVQSEQAPELGEECDVCRWDSEADEIMKSTGSPNSPPS